MRARLVDQLLMTLDAEIIRLTRPKTVAAFRLLRGSCHHLADVLRTVNSELNLADAGGSIAALVACADTPLTSEGIAGSAQGCVLGLTDVSMNASVWASSRAFSRSDSQRRGVGRQNVERLRIGDAEDVPELLRLLLTTVVAWARPRQDLVVENLLLRHQLAVLTRPTRARPRARLRASDKLLWILARRWCARWREHLALVTPDTVVRWHRQGWRLFWRWKSRSRGGRPHLGVEVRELIAIMSRKNRLWGAERIRGELLKLGIVVSNRSIRRYRWRGPAHSPSQTWRTFLANQAHHLWAADLFTVPTLTFKTLYVLVFIAHDRRELAHVNVTANPTAAWVWRQVIEATPWGHKPRHLLHDRDAVYGRDFYERARRIGVDAIATPVPSPRANAVAERVIGTLRRECLDHLIVLDEHHLASVLGEFAAYYNRERPHRTLGLQTPEPRPRPTTGAVRSYPVLNGLHHVYERAA